MDLACSRSVRTCFGCRDRKNAGDLLRFTADSSNGVLVLDGKKKTAGRGVYCCNDGLCLAKFSRNKKGLIRSLRLKTIDVSRVEQLCELK